MSNLASAIQESKLELPSPGVWEIDPAHSTVGFVARHLMVAKVRGGFGSFSGTLTIGQRPEDAKVDATIEAASIDTGDETRDAHLRSADFLNVENYPTLAFETARVSQTGLVSLRADGSLTIRGVSRPVSLDITYLGLAQDPFGNSKAVFSAETEIDREDWDITWNKTLETGGVLVGRKVKIELEIQAVRKP
jgi:polyisoprenoid-binding protein YceI